VERNSIGRSVLTFAALVVAGSAMAQSTDKEPLAPSKQSATKSSTTKPAAAPKRLDFAPSGSVKETAATRAAAPDSAQPTQSPAKEGSNCHSKESDA
jgi:hypothetical protein